MTHKIKTILGKRLLILRHKLGLSQRNLAQKLGLNPSTYFRYEKSQREPSIDVLIKIAEFFNVTTDYLLGLSDY